MMLYVQATLTPSPIRVNIFKWPVFTDCTARTRNGQPAQNTTGVASKNSAQYHCWILLSAGNSDGAISSNMAIKNTGNVNTPPIMKRFNMSLYSLLSGSTSTVVASKAIPQIGQSPGSSCMTSGCIGQVYSVFWLVETGGSGSNAIPHFGQLPGPSFRTPSHMGQI